MSTVTDRFQYKRPSPAGVSRIETIRSACLDLAALIEKTCPSCRETSLALTKLEEVSFWANKGIVFNDIAPSDNG